MPSPEKATEDRSVEGADRGRLWKVLFGTVGATAATAFAVTQLRQTVNWFSNQLSRSPLYASWRSAINVFSPRSFREEAWQKSSRRLQEEYEEEMERVERIRQMQSVFNRQRNKYKRSYESWKDSGPGAYQQFQRDDWYWKTDTTYKHQRANSGAARRESGIHALSHHYSILGLNRFRAKPYTEEEIKGSTNIICFEVRRFIFTFFSYRLHSGKKPKSAILIKTRITKRLPRKSLRKY